MGFSRVDSLFGQYIFYRRIRGGHWDCLYINSKMKWFKMKYYCINILLEDCEVVPIVCEKYQ